MLNKARPFLTPTILDHGVRTARFRRMIRLLIALAAFVAALMLSACQKPPPKPPQPIAAASQLLA